MESEESDERVPLTQEPLVVHFILLSPNHPNSVNSFILLSIPRPADKGIEIRNVVDSIWQR